MNSLNGNYAHSCARSVESSDMGFTIFVPVLTVTQTNNTMLIGVCNWCNPNHEIQFCQEEWSNFKLLKILNSLLHICVSVNKHSINKQYGINFKRMQFESLFLLFKKAVKFYLNLKISNPGTEWNRRCELSSLYVTISSNVHNPFSNGDHYDCFAFRQPFALVGAAQLPIVKLITNSTVCFLSPLHLHLLLDSNDVLMRETWCSMYRLQLTNGSSSIIANGRRE